MTHTVNRAVIVASLAGVVAAFWLTAPTAWADETAPDGGGGRYLFEKQPGGKDSSYLRLDTATGAVSLCSQREVGFTCEAVPEDRAVFENEIARLREENAALKKIVIAHGLPLPPGLGAAPSAEPPVAQNNDLQNNQLILRLPSDADIDRMVALAGKVWHRFVDAIERAQKQVFNKS